MENELESRVAHLENVCALQQQMIDMLGAAVLSQQASIETLVFKAGKELQPQPAPRAPLN
jgi:uncharacterized coiled-coil protein SlyX